MMRWEKLCFRRPYQTFICESENYSECSHLAHLIHIKMNAFPSFRTKTHGFADDLKKVLTLRPKLPCPTFAISA